MRNRRFGRGRAAETPISLSDAPIVSPKEIEHGSGPYSTFYHGLQFRRNAPRRRRLFTGSSTDTDLDRAAEVVKYLTRPTNLERSTFTAIYPDARPTEYVEFMFSTAGTAEWPDGEDWADEESKEMHRMARMPLRPTGVGFVARWPDENAGKQIVVTADDERWVLIVEGYEDPNEAPVTLHEWTFPRVEIDEEQAEVNQLFADSLSDMGMGISARRGGSRDRPE